MMGSWRREGWPRAVARAGTVPAARAGKGRRWLVLALIGALLIVAVAAWLWSRGRSPLPGVPMPAGVKRPIKPTRLASTMTIATWNILNLGPRTPVELRAKVLKDYDFVGVQEVESLIGLERLVEELTRVSGVVWQSVDSGKQVGKGNAGEYYAFLFKTDLVEHLSTGTRGIYADPGDIFSREPFCATFRARNFDFTAVNVHITWGKDRALRGKEVEELARAFDAIQGLDPNENDILLMGDFNTDGPLHKAWAPLRGLGVLPVLSEGKTTLSGARHKEYASFYDNIWYPKQHTREFSGRAGIQAFHTVLFPGDPHPNITARKQVSDHLPVWAEFRIDGPDDD